MTRRVTIIGAALLAACATPPGNATQPGEASMALKQLGEDYWEYQLSTNPTMATHLGDHRFNDRLEEIGPAARERDASQWRSFLERLSTIDRDALDESERVSYDILKTYLDEDLEAQRHKGYQWDLNQLYGPQVWLQRLVQVTPLKGDADYDKLLARYDAFPRWMDEYIANLQEGLDEGRTVPTVVVERVIGQLDALLKEKPEESEFLPPAGPRTRFLTAIRDSVFGSYRKLLYFLRNTYRGRETVGISSIPGGAEAYEYRIRHHTTLPLTADQIHRIGLDEIASIHREMVEIARRNGHDGDAPSFIARVKATGELFATSREQLIDGYREILTRVDAKLPEFFGTLPTIGYAVEPMPEYQEKDAPTAYYEPPPEDGTRPGKFLANTYDPPSRPLYGMAALAVHEAVPGHHMQIAVALERKDLPAFRRHGRFTAFVEGWGLYAERLAVEMGVYRDDMERFGMLMYQAWRAARLVVDTGMHAKGWTREQAMQFVRENVGLTEKEMSNEIDRYIIWPGQALAYTIGRREIERIRAKAEAALGDRFDIREFHDRVLLNGPLPLSTLADNIERWAAEKSP